MATRTFNNSLSVPASIQGGGVCNCLADNNLALSNSIVYRLGFNCEPRKDSLCI